MKFVVISRNTAVPSVGQNTVYLKIDHWNDYSFVTLFEVHVFDENGAPHQLSNVRIGFVDQKEETSTYSTLPEAFDELPENYFSLGIEVEYYVYIANNFSGSFREEFLNALKDVVFLPSSLQTASNQKVFHTSHLRSITMNAITQQFSRVLEGGNPLTDFNFRFTLDQTDKTAGFTLDFSVEAHSKPSTNIHSIIGRNGVGKTSLMNQMIHAVTSPDSPISRFEQSNWMGHQPIGNDFFSSVVSVSFSAFDPFSPPPDQPDPSKGTCYFYVGLKDYAGDDGAILKPLSSLYDEFSDSLDLCLGDPGKKKRWMAAVQSLESDQNFADMGLLILADVPQNQLKEHAHSFMRRMSSGHVIVLLTITKLVARVEEKTLVLIDEPESHLHPPLLSAFIRSLSELLFDRNAVAIIATHSPVVLQEVPASCVWRIVRKGLASSWNRPEIETFGENVGILTREIFGLEVSKSGFNAILQYEAQRSGDYAAILEDFSNQIGFEGRAILRSILNNTEHQ